MFSDPLSNITYEERLDELGQRMSRLSEQATGYAWHERVAEELPHLCYEIIRRGEPDCFDTRLVLESEARQLVMLAERLGHWVTLLPGRRGWMPHIPQSMRRSRDQAR